MRTTVKKGTQDYFSAPAGRNTNTYNTFSSRVNRHVRDAEAARNGGDVDDASAAGDGGFPEERVRELADVEARLQVGGHDPRVVLCRALRRRPEHHLRRVVHLPTCSQTQINVACMAGRGCFL